MATEMTVNLEVVQDNDQRRPRIVVIGVGGAGGNAVNNMIQSNLDGVEFLVANTDAQALQNSQCERRILLGRDITKGQDTSIWGSAGNLRVSLAPGEHELRFRHKDAAEGPAASDVGGITLTCKPFGYLINTAFFMVF